MNSSGSGISYTALGLGVSEYGPSNTFGGPTISSSRSGFFVAR